MLATSKQLISWMVLTGTCAVAALYLYTLPALRRLPKQKEQSLN